MNSLKKHFNNLSLHRKLYFLAGFVLLMYSFLVLSFSYIINQQHISYSHDQVDYYAQTISDNVKRLTDQIESVTYDILSDRSLQFLLQTAKSTEQLQYEVHKNIHEKISASYSMNSKIVTDIQIILQNGQIITAHNPRFPESPRLDQSKFASFLKKVKSLDGAVLWGSFIDNDQPVILAARVIRAIENLSLEPLGIVCITVSPGKLFSEAGNRLADEDTVMFFMANEGALYSNVAPLVRSAILTSTPAIGGFLHHDGYIITRRQFLTLGINLFFGLPYKSFFAQSLTLFISIFVVLLAFSTFFIGTISRFLATLDRNFDMLYTRIREENVQRNTYDYSPEFRALSVQFQAVESRLQRMINVNHIQRERLVESELNALKAQINPHFLYNTLETINWQAKVSGNQEVSLLIESLGKLLRSVLNSSAPTQPLKAELEIINSYMIIQKFRFSSRVDFSFDIEEDTMVYHVPKLCLQPLVENAIKYGLEENMGTCKIIIKSRKKAQTLFLEVRNTNSRFPDGMQEMLTSKDQKKFRGMGVGLRNIQERIHLLYGSSYELDFSHDDGWAVVTLTVPCTMEE
ncbi:MAG: sensor histidine kinase [Sphaerochaeta sp.]|jgi:two-component system sensor histidine kinase YesM|uniref:cache domain-containing sensor histidine kinase n=1 Tax=Sphaerochaeta sp. TaxID=1972642 RepID=UPI003D0A8527